MPQAQALRQDSDRSDVSDEIKYDFNGTLRENGQELRPVSIDTLQINVTRLCNQACVHCHVDASPRRREQMDLSTVNRCLEILEDHDRIRNLDITGGAPELNPHFEHLVREAVKLGKHVMVRHNLTVTLDGNPVTGESKSHLPAFYAGLGVEVISSLPYYQEYFTDKQRGKGVFEKSIKSIILLNSVGYGMENTGLVLNFVYNPVGAFLPAPQKSLEADFKRELRRKYGIVFNNLYTITNMPINRFKQQLKKIGAYDEYMTRLVNAYNPAAAEGVMCRSLVSVGYDGRIYDCDFNQMLDLALTGKGKPMTVFDFDYERLLKRRIIFGSHCFGCTAGSGSGCGGATA
ncbi:MAG TPA: arsenosugar biosynthesis radical SAM (seleno)protein ArsS [Thermodesulfobacteriota bacterium]|nr:arsenosugar biosynthesis radical SAM (seleno)protein ArsS [Thermodesulfobacteriota bacterium]